MHTFCTPAIDKVKGNYIFGKTLTGCINYSGKGTVNCKLGDEKSGEISNDEAGSTITMDVYPDQFVGKPNINITAPSQQITTNTATELNTHLPAGVYMITTLIDGQMKTVWVLKTK